MVENEEMRKRVSESSSEEEEEEKVGRLCSNQGEH
jgi:hypothetical protein